MSAPPKYELARRAREILARYGAGPLPGLAAMNGEQMLDLLRALCRMDSMAPDPQALMVRVRGADALFVCDLSGPDVAISATGDTPSDALFFAADEWRRQVRMARLRAEAEVGR